MRAKLRHGIGVALLGCRLIPAHGCGTVLVMTVTAVEHIGDRNAPINEPGLPGENKPIERRCVVLLDARAVVVTDAGFSFGIGVFAAARINHSRR